MFERFTERARQVIVLARAEARELRHDYIGTEHLLLGLVAEDDGFAARALERFDVTTGRVREQIAVLRGGSGEERLPGQIPFTPRAKETLERALREALSLGHRYIGTEHLLLALTAVPDATGTRILSECGADAEAVRAEMIRLLGNPKASPPLPPVRTHEALAERLARLDALLKGWQRRAEVTKLAMGAPTRDEARRLVADRLGIGEQEVERLLDLRLGQLPEAGGKWLHEERERVRRALAVLSDNAD